MALSNAERQIRLRDKRNSLAKRALKASEEIRDEIRQTAEYGIDMLEEKEKLTGRLSGVDADGLLRFRAMRTVLSPEGMRKIREVCRVGPVSPERVMAVVFAPEMPTTRN